MKRVLFSIGLFAVILFVAFSGKFNVTPSDYATEISREGLDRHTAPDDTLHELTLSKKPKFPIGSFVYLQMKDSTFRTQPIAKVTNVFTTFAYAVSYQSIDSNDQNDYQWIINEEIRNAKPTGYEEGVRVILHVNRMPGMFGSLATINRVEHTNVYQLEWVDAQSNPALRKQRWFIENELREKK